MIDRRELLDMATKMSLQPHVVEKDYALGWMLAGINAHPAIRDRWVFKGDTCLKKCFFETYRFSEDLDFTLTDEAQIEDAFLRATFGETRRVDLRPDRYRDSNGPYRVRHLRQPARHDILPGQGQLSRSPARRRQW